jgi:hypothetical protein
VEVWEKVKLTKESLEKQISNVLHYLERRGYHKIAEVESNLKNPDSVIIKKIRKSLYVSKCFIEFCEIEVEGTQILEELKPMKWISISIETSYSPTDIVQLLQSDELMRLFLHKIQKINEISQENHLLALSVVLGGYPFWICYITGNTQEEDLRAQNELLGSI